MPPFALTRSAVAGLVYEIFAAAGVTPGPVPGHDPAIAAGHQAPAVLSLELQNYVEAELSAIRCLKETIPTATNSRRRKTPRARLDYAQGVHRTTPRASPLRRNRLGDDFAASDGEGWSAPELTPERGEIDVRTDADLGNVFQDEHRVTRIESQGESEGLGLSAGGWSGVGGTPGGDDPVSLEAYVAAQGHDAGFPRRPTHARDAGSGRPA